MKSLILDNYDSFSYNLFQMVAEVNEREPLIVKNNEMTWEALCESEFDNIIISPGPGHPNNEKDFGICARVIAECEIPLLGVCLGHQGICCVYGGLVSYAPEPIHGQIHEIIHNEDALYADIPKKFNVVRYHSLVAHKQLPKKLEATAWTPDGLIMGIKHKEKPIWGVQFHPESVCTEYGYQLFTNFKKITENFYLKEKNIKRKIGRAHQQKLIIKSTNEKRVNNSSHKENGKEKYRLLVRAVEKKLDTSDLYQKFCKGKNNAVWLDSSRIVKGMSSLSIIGCLGGPLSYTVKYHASQKRIEILREDCIKYVNVNIFDFLKQELSRYKIKNTDLPFDFYCGFVGYFGYELKSETVSAINHHCFSYPDAQFLFLDRAIVYDHEKNICYLLVLCHDALEDQSNHWLEEMQKLVMSCNTASIRAVRALDIIYPHYELERNKSDYIDDIKKCFDYIRDGDSYEICLTNRIIIKDNVDPLSYYLILRHINPATYAAFLKFDDLSIACSSIERFLRIDSKGLVETKPIKGTLPRGSNEVEEQKIIKALKNDMKFKSENLMIVDLLRNDLGIVCEIGSVHVPTLMQVETYETVHQLVSTVRGQLKQDMTAIDCIKACFPGGSMTGAPKVRTLEIIDELEKSPRGVYSGAIGYLSLNGAVDLNIVIRTAIITPNEMRIGVGGAIINLSNPQEEYNEILLKAKSLLIALAYYRKDFEKISDQILEEVI